MPALGSTEKGTDAVVASVPWEFCIIQKRLLAYRAVVGAFGAEYTVHEKSVQAVLHDLHLRSDMHLIHR